MKVDNTVIYNKAAFCIKTVTYLLYIIEANQTVRGRPIVRCKKRLRYGQSGDWTARWYGASVYVVVMSARDNDGTSIPWQAVLGRESHSVSRPVASLSAGRTTRPSSPPPPPTSGGESKTPRASANAAALKSNAAAVVREQRRHARDD